MNNSPKSFVSSFSSPSLSTPIFSSSVSLPKIESEPCGSSLPVADTDWPAGVELVLTSRGDCILGDEPLGDPGFPSIFLPARFISSSNACTALEYPALFRYARISLSNIPCGSCDRSSARFFPSFASFSISASPNFASASILSSLSVFCFHRSRRFCEDSIKVFDHRIGGSGGIWGGICSPFA